jgi:hypothetical protein
MKLLPAGLGAEPKKLAFLGVLLGVLIVVYFLNRNPSSPASEANSPAQSSGRSSGQATPGSAAQSVPVAAARLDVATPMPAQRSQRASETAIQDFKPSLKPPEGTDVSRIDPTLRLDLIAKLRTLEMEGGTRSIFDFGTPPPPKQLPSVQPIKPALTVPKPGTSVAGVAPAKPATPAIPPIPLKFYGYVDASSTMRRAFFLQGDDIFVAGENDVISSRYKILRINANSALVEDTTNKNQQTLPLVEELPG